MSGSVRVLRGPDGIPFDALIVPPRASAAPGILVLAGAGGLDASTHAWCERYAAEGYATIAPDLSRHIADGRIPATAMAAALADVYVAKSALAPFLEAGAKTGALGIDAGAALALRAAQHGAVDAAALYGLADVDGPPPHDGPLAIHVSGDAGPAPTATGPQVRVHAYPATVAGFADPLSPAFEPHAAGLAHTRSLDVFRPALGPHFDFARLFHEHAAHEFVDRDADATMETMVEEPYVNHVPTLTGGVGYEMLKRFYMYHFIPKVPQSRESVVLSETVGSDAVVIEHVSVFTHDEEMDYFLPGIPPTGKRLEVPTVIIAKFRGGKLYHEHIYWDQASVLAQLGLIDAAALPVAGVEEARKMLDQSQPANRLMCRWDTSEGKPV